MPNLAQITLIGHLGRDVETKYLPSGDPVAEFSVATTMKRKSGDVPTWWKCSAFGKTAEIASQYLAKGDAVMVIGTAYNEPWQDKDGADRLTLRCMVDRIVLLGKREAPATKTEQAEYAAQPKTAAKPAQKQAAGEFIEDDFDNLPF